MADTKTVNVETTNARASTTLTDTTPTVPLPDMPQGLMVIGPQVTLHFVEGAWNKSNSYDYYDVVQIDGTSYIAVQDVPANTEITNTEYWAKWNDPNAQVQLLQQTVSEFDDRITDVTDSYKNAMYSPEDYKNEGETDYTQAFQRIFNDISTNKTHGTIVGNGVYSGVITVNIQNVTFMGCTFENTVTVSMPSSANDSPSAVCFENCCFYTGDSHGLNITAGTGIKISNCEFKQTVNGCGIYSHINPTINQQIKQMIVSNCRFYGGYSIFIDSLNTTQTTGYIYLGADITITGCQMVNLIGNVHLIGVDGFVISNNTMFLSLGGSNKLDNIIADLYGMPVITGNQLFEAGRNGIRLLRGQNGSITGNNIVWCGQYIQEAGIYASGKSVNGTTNRAVMNISNNIIDHPSGDGIYNTKDAVAINLNSVFYAGSSDHWKGAGEVSTTGVYSIESTSDMQNLIGNNMQGSYGYQYPDTKENTNVNALNFGASSSYFASYRYFGFDKPIQITNETKISYNSKMPFLLVVNQASIDESVIKGDAGNYPKMGAIMCYTQACKIGSHTLQPQKPELFIIYGGNINWVSTQQS